MATCPYCSTSSSFVVQEIRVGTSSDSDVKALCCSRCDKIIALLPPGQIMMNYYPGLNDIIAELKEIKQKLK